MNEAQIEAERKYLQSEHTKWRQAEARIDSILSAKQLFDGLELQRARDAKYNIQAKISEIDEALQQNKRRERLLKLAEIETMLDEELNH